MATITEDYVSFETAKLLKEKGFMDDAIVKFFASGYDSKGNILNIRDTELKDYPRPTIQMAMKWLREVYGIYVVFFHTDRSGWWFNITNMKDSYVLYVSEKTKCSFEEICEAAIKYCLEELI